jgi:2-keto-3-deoxy-L-rhamnonate aldolase RhmA
MTRLSEAILNDTKGLSFAFSDPALVRLVKDKLDFILLDAATTSFSSETLAHFIAASGETPFFVRAEDCMPATLQKYLNAGVDGLVLTGLQYASEVEKAIACCLFPPEGIRPFTRSTMKDISLQALNDQLTLIVEVAHLQTVAQMGDIADIAGVDGILIAPIKLAVAMERDGDITHTDVRQAVSSVVTVAQSFDLFWGWEGLLPEDLTPSFHVMASDIDLVQYGLEHLFPEVLGEDVEETEIQKGLRAVR